MEFNEAFDPIRALKTSWTAIKAAPLPLLVGGGILVITDGGGGGGGGNFNMSGRQGDFDLEKLWPFIAGFGALMCCLGIVFFVISSWIQIGFARSVEEVVRTGTGDIGTVFDAKGRLGTMVLARLLKALIAFGVALPFIAVVVGLWIAHEKANLHENAAILMGFGAFLVWFPILVYVAIGLTLVEQAVALEGRSATESIRRSWSLASGHRWPLLLYGIVTGIFGFIGVCACCVGIFLTVPMRYVAWNESFLSFTRGDERKTWWIETHERPPTPTAGWGTEPPGWGSPPPPPPPSTLPPPPPAV